MHMALIGMTQQASRKKGHLNTGFTDQAVVRNSLRYTVLSEGVRTHSNRECICTRWSWGPHSTSYSAELAR